MKNCRMRSYWPNKANWNNLMLSLGLLTGFERAKSEICLHDPPVRCSAMVSYGGQTVVH